MEYQGKLLEAMTGRRGRKEGRREARKGGGEVVEHLSKKMNRTRAKSQSVTTTNLCKHWGHPGMVGFAINSSRAALSAQVCQG